MNKTVLMIAYEYKPFPAGGAMRSVVFAEELVNLGWKTIVLTPKAPYGDDLIDGDHGATEVIRSRGLTIHSIESALKYFFALFGRSGTAFFDRIWWRVRKFFFFLCWPDSTIGWAMCNFFTSSWLILSRRVDVVYTTSWPLSDHVVGLFLKKIFRIPWVADFRDPFIRHFNYGKPSPIRRAMDRWLEKAVCENASIVVTPTLRCSEDFRSLYGTPGASKFHTIRNGYDEREFTGSINRSEKLTFLHAGAFYLSRKPDLLLDAIQFAIDSGKSSSADLEVLFIGKNQEDGFSMEKYERYPFVKNLGLQSRAVSINLIRSSQVLVLIRHPECGLTIPGKLYEYMASGGFLLILTGKEDELQQVLAGYPNLILLREPSVAEVANAVFEILDRYKKGALIQLAPSVSHLSRQAGAKVLSDSLESLI